MRVCTIIATGKIFEAQSGDSPDFAALLANAAAAGYAANQVVCSVQADAVVMEALRTQDTRKPRSLLALYNAINLLTGPQRINIGNDLFDTVSTPSATNTTTDTLTFAADPTWPTGSLLSVATTVGGLTAGTGYYYRRVTATTGTLHPTLADATANTAKVNLTANVTAAITRPGRWSSNTGSNRSGMFAIYASTLQGGLSAANLAIYKAAGAAMMAQDVPGYLVNPVWDSSINVPGDEAAV